MVARKQQDEMIALFEELRQACEREEGFDIDDTNAIDSVVSKIKSGGISVIVRQDSSSVEFDREEPATNFKREMTLYFEEIRVYQWREEYWGYYGAMGTGWWQELHEGGLSEGLEYGLNELVDIPEADVPKPAEAEIDENK